MWSLYNSIKHIDNLNTQTFCKVPKKKCYLCSRTLQPKDFSTITYNATDKSKYTKFAIKPKWMNEADWDICGSHSSYLSRTSLNCAYSSTPYCYHGYARWVRIQYSCQPRTGNLFIVLQNCWMILFLLSKENYISG